MTHQYGVSSIILTLKEKKKKDNSIEVKIWKLNFVQLKAIFIISEREFLFQYAHFRVQIPGFSISSQMFLDIVVNCTDVNVTPQNQYYSMTIIGDNIVIFDMLIFSKDYLLKNRN